MSELNLYSSFSFASDQDWEWQVVTNTATLIVLSDGVNQQSFAGGFTVDADGFLAGIVLEISFYQNSVLVYYIGGLAADANRLQSFASNFGDTQATNAYVLQDSDVITGSSGSDTLLGYEGDDVIDGAGGNDNINGGLGNDTAVFSGNRSDATITYSGSGTVFSISTASGGTDTVSGVENFRFLDQTVTAASFMAVPPPPDDFLATDQTTGRLAVGGSVTGQVGVMGDKDWFAVSLTSGQAYTFHLDGVSGTGIGDPYLTLFDAGGNQLAFDDDGGPGVYAMLAFSATQSGTYYLEASAYGVVNATGNYVLSAAIAVLPDTTQPTIASFDPVDGATGVAPEANLVFTFNEDIVRGSGAIVLKTLDGAVVESFEAATSNRLTISGASLTIDPSNALASVQSYEIVFGSGSILDLAGNAFVFNGRYDWRVAAPSTGPGSGKIDLVSSTPTGVIGDAGTNSGDDSAPAVSANGGFVVFNSWAGNLVAGDSNNNHDTFVKSMTSGAVSYVSTNSAGDAPSRVDQYGAHFSVSANGRYVAFETYANNLVDITWLADPNSPNGSTLNDSTITSGDNNTSSDVYVKDMFGGAVFLASSNANGLSANNAGGSGYVNSHPAMSADGNFVAFSSLNNVLVIGDTNATVDIFIKHIHSGTISRISTTATGEQANGRSDHAAFSADGRFVVFSSTASNLVSGDTNGLHDIFRKNIATGEIVLVSTTRTGVQTAASPDTNDGSFWPTISGDGRYVLFETDAKNLVPEDTDVYPAVFYKDLQTGDIQRITAQVGTTFATNPSASMSDDARYVVFTTREDLVTLPFRHDSGSDVFIKDMQTQETRIVSAFPLDVAPLSLDGTISADGRYVVLKSTYDPDDTSTGYQIFRLANPFLEQSSATNYTLASTDVALTLTGSADISGTGNAFANTLIGNIGNNVLTGGAGNDALDGGIGRDTAVFSGSRADYDISFDVAAQLFSVTDHLAGRDGIDSLAAIEVLKFSDAEFAASLFMLGKAANLIVYSWKAHTLLEGVAISGGAYSGATNASGALGFAGVTEGSLALTAARPVPEAEVAATDSAVNLQDAIAILKMIVGLEVNGAGKPLSPYQTLAADFDGNGAVGLTDAIGVLKHVVGLSAPEPTWHFLNEVDPGVPANTINADLGTGRDHIGLVAHLSGDVDGSFAGAAGALDLDATQPGYFQELTSAQGLHLSQFGIYTV